MFEIRNSSGYIRGRLATFTICFLLLQNAGDFQGNAAEAQFIAASPSTSSGQNSSKLSAATNPKETTKDTAIDTERLYEKGGWSIPAAATRLKTRL